MSVQHIGKFFRREIERLGIKKKQAAKDIGVEPVTLRSWFLSAIPKMRGDNRSNMAKLLGMKPEALETMFLEAMRNDPATRARWQAQEKQMREAGADFADQLAAWEDIRKHVAAEESISSDLNVSPYSEVEVEEIPMFELPIAAGVMTELPDAEEMHDPRLLRLKRFRVKIRGESMEKEYPDGSVVEFKCLEWHADGTASRMEVNKDYYVQSQDTATFKRLAEIHDGELVFVALNKRKFPVKIRLLRDDITRMAKAVAVIRFVG